MDIRPIDASATAEERQAVDARLGAPRSSWDGGPRGTARDAHVATVGGGDSRAMRHLLLPALQALQARVGWISEGGLGYICDRRNVPPRTPGASPPSMRCSRRRAGRNASSMSVTMSRASAAGGRGCRTRTLGGPGAGHAPRGRHVQVGDTGSAWVRSPCAGEVRPGAGGARDGRGTQPREMLLLGPVTAASVQAILDGGSPDEAIGQTVLRQPASELRLLRRVGVVSRRVRRSTRVGGFAASRRRWRWARWRSLRKRPRRNSWAGEARPFRPGRSGGRPDRARDAALSRMQRRRVRARHV